MCSYIYVCVCVWNGCIHATIWVLVPLFMRKRMREQQRHLTKEKLCADATNNFILTHKHQKWYFSMIRHFFATNYFSHSGLQAMAAAAAAVAVTVVIAFYFFASKTSTYAYLPIQHENHSFSAKNSWSFFFFYSHCVYMSTLLIRPCCFSSGDGGFVSKFNEWLWNGSFVSHLCLGSRHQSGT